MSCRVRLGYQQVAARQTVSQLSGHHVGTGTVVQLQFVTGGVEEHVSFIGLSACPTFVASLWDLNSFSV